MAQFLFPLAVDGKVPSDSPAGVALPSVFRPGAVPVDRLGLDAGIFGGLQSSVRNVRTRSSACGYRIVESKKKNHCAPMGAAAVRCYYLRPTG